MQGTAIAGDTCALDEGIDAIAITLCIAAAFQHHHAKAFTQDGPVRLFTEGPDLLFAR